MIALAIVAIVAIVVMGWALWVLLRFSREVQVAMKEALEQVSERMSDTTVTLLERVQGPGFDPAVQAQAHADYLALAEAMKRQDEEWYASEESLTQWEPDLRPFNEADFFDPSSN